MINLSKVDKVSLLPQQTNLVLLSLLQFNPAHVGPSTQLSGFLQYFTHRRPRQLIAGPGASAAWARREVQRKKIFASD